MKYILRFACCLALASTLSTPQAENALPKIELGEQTTLQLGGQIRVRWENWDGFGFGDNEGDFGLLRTRVYGDLNIGESVRVFIEGKSALSTDRDLPGGRRTLDVDSLDLQNAFVDLDLSFGESTFILRSGRQELNYGKQRLISPLDWSNTRRTFDGVRGFLTHENGWKTDLFWTRLTPIQKYEFNDGDSGRDLYGIYATAPKQNSSQVEFYLLGLDRENAAFGGLADDEERYTLGARFHRGRDNDAWDLDAEGAYQWGDHGTRDISAFMASAQAGYTLEETSLAPRLYLGFDYASGDEDPSDNELGTFNQLFPLGHAYLGYIDTVGRQNILDYSQGIITAIPSLKSTLKIEHHIFQRAEETDALYNAGGGVARRGAESNSDDVGRELDLTLIHKCSSSVTTVLGYSLFFAGDFISDTGNDNDIEFFYGSVQYDF